MEKDLFLESNWLASLKLRKSFLKSVLFYSCTTVVPAILRSKRYQVRLITRFSLLGSALLQWNSICRPLWKYNHHTDTRLVKVKRYAYTKRINPNRVDCPNRELRLSYKILSHKIIVPFKFYFFFVSADLIDYKSLSAFISMNAVLEYSLTAYFSLFRLGRSRFPNQFLSLKSVKRKFACI